MNTIYQSRDKSKYAPVVQAVRQTTLGKDLKILIGGLPVTQRFAKSIGADGYGIKAHLAVIKALDMVK